MPVIVAIIVVIVVVLVVSRFVVAVVMTCCSTLLISSLSDDGLNHNIDATSSSIADNEGEKDVALNCRRQCLLPCSWGDGGRGKKADADVHVNRQASLHS